MPSAERGYSPEMFETSAQPRREMPARPEILRETGPDATFETTIGTNTPGAAVRLMAEHGMVTLVVAERASQQTLEQTANGIETQLRRYETGHPLVQFPATISSEQAGELFHPQATRVTNRLVGAAGHIPEGGLIEDAETTPGRPAELPASLSARVYAETINTHALFGNREDAASTYRPYLELSDAHVARKLEEMVKRLTVLEAQTEEARRKAAPALEKAAAHLGQDLFTALRQARMAEKIAKGTVLLSLIRPLRKVPYLDSREKQDIEMMILLQESLGNARFQEQSYREDTEAVADIRGMAAAARDMTPEQILDSDKVRALDGAQRFLLGETLQKEGLLSGKPFEHLMNEPGISRAEEAAVEKLAAARRVPGATTQAILASPRFEQLSREARYVLYLRLGDTGASLVERRTLIEEKKLVLAGRPGDRIDAYLRRADGTTVPLHDQFRGGREKFRLREAKIDVDAPVLTPEVAVAVRDGDELLLLPARPKDRLLPDAETALRLADEQYPDDPVAADTVLLEAGFPAVRLRIGGA